MQRSGEEWSSQRKQRVQTPCSTRYLAVSSREKDSFAEDK